MVTVLALVMMASPAELTWEPRVDVPVDMGLLAIWLSTETFLKPSLAPAACRWCAPNAFDTAVRTVFNPSLTPSASGLAGPDAASSVGQVVTPVVMLGLDLWLSWRDGALGDFPADLTIVAEATLGALCFNQALKFVAGRARPYTVGAPAGLVDTSTSDENLSFASGHTTFAFAAVSAAGTVATLRGYRLAWLTWVIGYPLAFTTALLRVAADKHWASDTLVGMAIGGAFGVGIPLLFHGRAAGGVQLQVSAAPGGIAVSGRW